MLLGRNSDNRALLGNTCTVSLILYWALDGLGLRFAISRLRSRIMFEFATC